MQSTNDAIQRHFKLRELKIDCVRKLSQSQKKTKNTRQSFGLNTSRDQSFGFKAQSKTYCAVDFYDIEIPAKISRGYSTPVKKRKKAQDQANEYILSQSPQVKGVRRFEGYLSRGNTRKEYRRTVNIEELEQLRISEQSRLQSLLESVSKQIRWIDEPRLFIYQRCETPFLLKQRKLRL